MKNDVKKSKNWQDERKRLLARVNRAMQAKIQKGITVDDAAIYCSAVWNGRTLKADPSKKLAMSPSAIIRHYYAWQKVGESAFDLHLRIPPRIPDQIIMGVVRICGTPGIWSIGHACRVYAEKNSKCNFKAKSLARRFTQDDRRNAADLFRARKNLIAARKHLSRVEKAFSNFIEARAAKVGKADERGDERTR